MPLFNNHQPQNIFGIILADLQKNPQNNFCVYNRKSIVFHHYMAANSQIALDQNVPFNMRSMFPLQVSSRHGFQVGPTPLLPVVLHQPFLLLTLLFLAELQQAVWAREVAEQ